MKLNDEQFNADRWPELFEGDPLADAVTHDLLEATPDQRQLLTKGMQHGVNQISNIPISFKKFLESSEAILMSVPSIQKAVEAYMLTTPLWISIGLGPGALIRTYSDPAIASTLTRTGYLVGEAVGRRLAETQIWNLQLLRPNAFSIGGSGYVHTLQVRLIHARVRAGLSKQEGSIKSTEIPINQRQMIRTWMDFSEVGPKAYELLGIEWTEEEKFELENLWQLVGKLLGIHPRLCNALAEPEIAKYWLKLMDANSPKPTEDTRRLTTAMLNSLGERMSDLMKLPLQMSISLMHAFARHIHGEAIADSVGATDSSLSALVPFYVDANRYRLHRLRQDTQLKQKHLEQVAADIIKITSN